MDISAKFVKDEAFWDLVAETMDKSFINCCRIQRGHKPWTDKEYKEYKKKWSRT